MTENYLSGKKRNLKIGVSGHSEHSTSLEVIGGVGIGTTTTDKRSLFVVGNAEVSGVLTASSFEGDGSGLTGVAATDHVATFDLVVAGISTFHDDVRITSGGINAVGVITGNALSYDYLQAPYGSTTTFTVTVAGKDSTHRYNGQGSGNAYLINGVQAPILNLTPGRTYRFNNTNTGSHPLKFYYEADRTTLYTTGVNFQSTYTEITISDTTPNVLHYQCTNHGLMGNAVITNSNVVDSPYAATLRSGLNILGTSTGIDASGISSFVQLDVNTGGIDVDGPTELDELNVTGVSTFLSSLKVDGAVDIGTGGLDVDGETQLDELVVAGVSTFTGNIVADTAEFSGNVTIGGTLTVEDKTNVDSIGLVTARTGVRVTAGGIDVTAGVSTFNDTVNFEGAVDIGTGGVDVDGHTELDELGVAGVTTFSNDVFVGTAITIHAGNVHATGIISAIKFVGDGSQITNLPGINTLGTSNLSDVNVSGTTTTTQLRVSGIGTAEKFFVSSGGLDVDGQTDLDELIVAGVATFSSAVDINAGIDVDGQADLDELVVAGVSTFSNSVDINSTLDVDGQTDLDELVVAGVSTFSKAIDLNAGIDVDGQADLDEVVVAGVATFSSVVDINDGLDVTGVSTFNDNVHLLDNDKLLLGGSAGTHDGLEIYHSGSHSFIDDTGTGNLKIRSNNLRISNVDESKVYATFTPSSVGLYNDGSEKFATTAVGATVYGNFKSTTLHVAGISTLTGNVNFVGTLNNVNASGILTAVQVDVSTGGLDVDGQTDLDEVVVAGVSSFTAYPAIDADNEVQVGTAIQLGKAGVVTATSFSGSGANLTSLNASQLSSGTVPDGRFPATLPAVSGANLTSLNATNLASGTVPDARFPATLPAISGENLTDIPTGINTANTSTFKDVVITGFTAAGIATFNGYPAIDANNEIQVGTAIQLGKAGVVTATSFSGSASGLTNIPSGQLTGALPAIDGSALTGIAATDHVSTFDLVVAGISTFHNDVKIVAAGSTAANQITIGATTLDNGTLTFEGSAGQLFSITNNLTDGSIFSVNDVSGMPSIDVGAAGTIQLAPHGADELVGIGTTRPTSKLDVVGDVQIAGVITATKLFGDGSEITNLGINTLTISSFKDIVVSGGAKITGVVTAGSFEGDGTNLTGIGTQGPNVQALGIDVAGISTFHDDVRILAGGLNVASGIVSATQLDIGTGGIDVDGHTELDNLNVSGVTTFNSPNNFIGNIVAYNPIYAQNFLYANGQIVGDNATNISGINSVTATAFYGDGLRIGGGTTITDDLTIESINPKIIFTDTNGAPDYNINCEGGKLYFNDSSDNNRILIEVDGHIEIPGNLEVASNITAIGGNYTGVVTALLFSGSGILDEDDMASDSATKLATQQSIKAYVDASAGGGGGGTGDFYVGFTSSVTMNAASYETIGHTFPSTESKTYTIDSIMASNIAEVGIGTTVNLIASISSNSGVAAGTTEQTYFAYNVPIAAGGAVELIKEPFVANPNDIVKLWATDSTYVGINSAIQVHMTYTQQDSTDFFGKYAANTSIGSTTIIGIHTAGPTYAAALQSIHITNRSDAGAFPVDILLTDSTGIVTTYLVKNLVIPKYSAVEILERPKRMETGSSLGVKVQQTGTIDVIVSGKTYS